MKLNKLASFVLLGSITAPVLAGEMNTPHEFQSGTPAYASEVNENFQAAQAAINDNNSRLAAIEAEVAVSKQVVLQDGLAGYSGTTDTTLAKTETDWNTLLIPGDKPTAQSFGAIHDTIVGEPVVVALLRFDVSGLADDMLGESEVCADAISVMDATLQLRGTIDNNRALYVTLMDPDAPLWVEAEADWTMSDAGANWPAGTYTDTPVLNSALLGYSEVREGWANSSLSQTLYFSIDTDFVKQWVCDETTNKGLLIRMSGGSSRFASSEFPRVPPRPKFKLHLQRN